MDPTSRPILSVSMRTVADVDVPAQARRRAEARRRAKSKRKRKKQQAVTGPVAMQASESGRVRRVRV